MYNRNIIKFEPPYEKAKQNDLQPAKTQISGASSLTDQEFVIYIPLIQPCLTQSVSWVANTGFHIKHVTDIHIKSVVIYVQKRDHVGFWLLQFHYYATF